MTAMIRRYMRKAPPGAEVDDVLADMMVLLLQRKQALPQDTLGFPTGPTAVLFCRYALATIARRHALRNRRYCVQDAHVLGRTVHATIGSPEDKAARNQIAERIVRWFRTLSPSDRKLTRFRLVDFLPFREISRRFCCSPATAMRRWHRTSQHLMERMPMAIGETTTVHRND